MISLAVEISYTVYFISQFQNQLWLQILKFVIAGNANLKKNPEVLITWKWSNKK